MKAPGVPVDEPDRLDALRGYDILDTPPEQVFDDLAALASHICNTPIALVSLVDADRQWFKAKVGLDADQTPRDISFCGHVVCDREPLVVADAREDPRFADNPLVLGPPGIRFYAGAPLEGPSGHIFGTLCVIDRVPRHLTETQREMLRALARQVVSQLELRRTTRLAVTAAQEVDAARRAAESANTAKSAFLANMSHELRTPLNSIIGFTHLMSRNKAGNLTQRDLGFLERIGSNGQHLLSLLNDILDISKIEAGRVELELETCSVAEIVTDVVNATEGDARARAVTLTWECTTTASIVADRRRMVQVLINLVGNGLKFARDGHVHVAVREAHGVPLRIDVSDNGVGIPAGKQTAIFAAFQQADASTSRQFGGSGLGLTIARALCRSMGFDLEVASEEGRGATFSVRLHEDAPPLVHTPPTHPQGSPGVGAAPSRPPPSDDVARKTVLVIDDDAEARMLLQHQLEELGYRVVAVDSGRRGLEIARVLRPDVITVDLLMPDLDGFTVLRELARDPDLADTPTIVCSVAGSDHRMHLARDVAVLDKPFTPDELETTLARMLDAGEHLVLAVCADEATRRLIHDALADQGLRVRTASAGPEALASVDAERPDAIVLDLGMPVTDGLSLLADLRQHPALTDVPIVVCPATTLTPDDERALQEARASLVTKNTSVSEELRRQFGRLLERP